jgi:organic radical activating enzyme
MGRRPQVYASDLNLRVGRQCNFTCRHCSVSSSPHVKQRMSAKTLAASLELIACFAARDGARRVVVTGGESFMYRKELAAIAACGRAHGLRVAVETNAYWATTPQRARAVLAEIEIDDYLISASRYHLEFTTWECLENAVAAIAEHPRKTSLIRATIEDENDPLDLEVVSRIKAMRSDKIEINMIAPVGRAEDMPGPWQEPVTLDQVSRCPAEGPVVLDDGRVDPCCGGFVALDRHAFTVGRLPKDAPAAVLDELERNVLFNTVRNEGFGPFVTALAELDPSRNWMAALRSDACGTCTALSRLMNTVSPDLESALKRKLEVRRAAADLAQREKAVAP